MCWKTNRINNIKEHIVRTKNGLKVLKICLLDKDERIIPYFYSDRLVYEMGKTYESEFEKYENQSFKLQICEGLHSYNSKKVFFEKSKHPWSNIYYFDISNKYGCIRNFNFEIGFSRAVSVECVIPYGSKYYENEYGEIVSDTLIPKKFVLVRDLL